MLKKITHYWRLLTEPSGHGRLQNSIKGRWQVRYPPDSNLPNGAVSHPLPYDVACDYASMWNGVVEKAGTKPTILLPCTDRSTKI